jgi:hypothetical protein
MYLNFIASSGQTEYVATIERLSDNYFRQDDAETFSAGLTFFDKDITLFESGGVGFYRRELNTSTWQDDAYQYTVFTSGNQSALASDSFTIRGGIEAPASGIVDANVVQVSGEVIHIDDFKGDLTNDGIADAVWDEILTGATHNIPTSAGRRLRDITSTVILTGTSTGGNTVNTLALNGDASAVDGAYDPAIVAIVAGTGSGQSRAVLEYIGTTKTCGLDRNWKVTPDNTSEYVIYSHPGREHVNEGFTRVATSNTLKLNELASTQDDEYNGQLIFIRSAPSGDDQVRLVEDYDGGSQIATVSHEWSITPPPSSCYSMLPYHQHTLEQYAVELVSGEYILDVNTIQISGELIHIDDLKYSESDIYYADIKYVKDAINRRDEFGIQWFKNTTPLASGQVISPRISLYNTVDGTAITENQLMTAAGAIGGLRYDLTSSLFASGEPYLAVTSGTIDSSVREWRNVVGIDKL